jgi:methylthioxylose transferase
MSTARSSSAEAWAGLVAAFALVAAAMLVPAAAHWAVHVHDFPPLHARWDPRVGPGTLPAALLAGLASWRAVDVAARSTWGRLLLQVYAAGLAWMLALAFVDGADGVGAILDQPYEYLRTARATHDFPAALGAWVDRIPFAAGADRWPVHVAGHPPGALGFFVVLDRLGLGSGWAAGLVVTLLAASTAVAVMTTMRVLGAEVPARRAAPFLVFGPAAVWQCVSADGMFAAVAAWGTAALAVAAVRRSVGWSVVAGLLLGSCVMLSYGLLLLGALAVAVLMVARSWRPLVPAAVAALAVVLAFAPYGFVWWEALPVLHDRYWAGVQRNRPASYWMWGNLAALAVSAGPLAFAGLGAALARWRDPREGPVRSTLWLCTAGVLMVAVADVSRLSQAEVERIWLPFVPWLLVACGLLPQRWRRRGLVLQIGCALLVQHLLATGW